MFEKKSKTITLETLTTLCDKELVSFTKNKALKPGKVKVTSVKKDDSKIRKIDIKQSGEDILWL